MSGFRGAGESEGPRNGFNLREVELGLSAEVDPYFRAWATVAVDEEGAGVEEAVLQTTSLPYGLTLSGGRIKSGFLPVSASPPRGHRGVESAPAARENMKPRRVGSGRCSSPPAEGAAEKVTRFCGQASRQFMHIRHSLVLMTPEGWHAPSQ